MLERHEHKHPVHDFDGITENRANSPPVYFSVLFYGLILWGTLFIAYFLLSDWSSEAEFRKKMAAHTGETATQQAAPAVAAPTTAPGAAPADGRQLYAEHCAACHGADGKGQYAPDLSSADYEYGKSPEAIRASITDGRDNKMPAFGGQLSAEEIDALVRFLQQL